MLYKLRKITTKNRTGDSFGITIQKDIALRNQNIFFRIMQSGPDIVLVSGARL